MHYTIRFMFLFLSSYNIPLIPMVSSSSSSSVIHKKTCNICLSKKTADTFHTFSCNHNATCTACLTQLINKALKEKSTNNLRCPSCRHQVIGEQDIKAITHNKKILDDYASITTKEWLNTQSNAKHCPTPDCQYAFINERTTQKNIQCLSCQKTYCSQCMLPHKKSISCTRAQESNQLDQSTSRWMQRYTKPCPRCKYGIQKISGCDHMTCRNCYYEFCWNCNAPYWNADGSHHPSYCGSVGLMQEYEPAPHAFHQADRNVNFFEIRELCSGWKECLIVSCICCMLYTKNMPVATQAISIPQPYQPHVTAQPTCANMLATPYIPLKQLQPPHHEKMN